MIPDYIHHKCSRPEQLAPLALAYIGDAVYELYVRGHYLFPEKKIANYHRQVVAQVRAETQAEQLRLLLPHLTDQEKEIARRGRNAVTTKPKRISYQIYQDATSLEALIGYLYLKNSDRLRELLAQIDYPS